MSRDIRGHPRMSQTWRQCQVPESQVQDVLGYPGTSRVIPDVEAALGPRVPGLRCPGTSQDVPDLEAVLSPRVPGPRCPGISGDIPGCSRPGGSIWSQSPRSKMSWDIRRHPRMSQTWRQCQVPESQVQDVLGYTRTSRDVPDLEAVLSLRVPGPRCPGISRDIPGVEAALGPRVPGLRCPGTSQDVPDLEAVLGPRVPGPRCPGISRDILGCPRPGGSVWSQSPRSKMSRDIRRHPLMSQTWRQCQVPESQVQGVLGYSRTSRDVPDLEAVLSPRVPGPRCPGISRDIQGHPGRGGSVRSQSPRPKMSWDIPGCPRPGGSVRSQSPRSKMSRDIQGHPGMSQTWRQC